MHINDEYHPYSNPIGKYNLPIGNRKRKKRFKRNVKLRLLYKDVFKCHYCKKDLTEYTMTIDHKTSLFNGGSNNEDNLVAACYYCNIKKGEMNYEEFLFLTKIDS